MITRIFPLITLVLALCLAGSAGAKVEPPSRPLTAEQLEQSLGFVKKLITVSSVAKQIEKSEFGPALAYLHEARRLHQQALADLAQGELISSAAKRDEAIKLVFEAGHLSQLANNRKEKPKQDYLNRLRSVSALSEAYKNIAEKNHEPQRVAQLEANTGGIITTAKRAADSEDFLAAKAQLDKAYEIIRSALDELRGGQTLGELSAGYTAADPRQNDYQSKLRSVNALLEAQQRIADEKSSHDDKRQIRETLTPLLNSAADYAATGDYDHAITTVNQAYRIVTAAIEHLRGGETLVRALHFETKEEEYHYELDRNDTYHMLIHMLVEDKKQMEITPRIQKFIDEANALRKLGEKQAAQGDFAEAIGSLEQSTRNLIFAMRNAGFFIPG